MTMLKPGPELQAPVVGLLLFTLGLPAKSDAQQIGHPRLVCGLPNQVTESSGLIIQHTNLFWTMNDSGGDALLYGFDSTGTCTDCIRVANAGNVDWEALATDGSGTFFIGDFGNNGNNRTDLTVCRLDSIGMEDTLHAEAIGFAYPDQIAFPAAANFDMEGFFFYEDSLYLFSKNKLFGGNGFTKLYSLPADSGTYWANLVDSLNVGVVVTGADISPSGLIVALMSYGRVILLENFTSTNFLSGTQRYLTIPFSQTESVAFLDDSTLYFTNEEGSLYTVSLAEEATNGVRGVLERGLNVFPNPNAGTFALDADEAWQVLLIDAHGRRMEIVKGEISVAPGVYLVHATAWDGAAQSVKVIVN